MSARVGAYGGGRFASVGPIGAVLLLPVFALWMTWKFMWVFVLLGVYLVKGFVGALLWCLTSRK